MIKTVVTILVAFLTMLTLSCREPIEESSRPEVTITSGVSTDENQEYSCADIDANWGNNWTVAIEVLDELIQQGQTCGDEPLTSKKYAAHFNYANVLETSGEYEAAVNNYTAAFLLDSNRVEALDALVRLDSLPDPTPVPCDSDLAPLPDPASPELPDELLFIQVEGKNLIQQGQPYVIRGVNYYPRQAPWHQFLLEADMSEITTELALIEQAGFNTIRIFLWYEPLFICQPEVAIPNERAFEKVDEIIQLAAERNLKLIVTLNDLPDLVFRPLYTD